ncbi:MAG: PEP/pyruvate-binding domain-containing protein [Novosphingobium sp.]|uniref:PEP/pyruvate-binding domain-containing protein n=1 Tax=Novosphingobium sp. TaxID=1874826 RepID=UPI0032BBB9ED
MDPICSTSVALRWGKVYSKTLAKGVQTMRKLLIAFLLLLTAPLLAAPAQMANIASEAQFAELARTSPGGRYASFPQVMFVIDRAAKGGPQLHFVNSRQYEFHIDFVQRSYLSTQTAEALLDANYSQPNRRFVFGSILHYQALGRYGVEFWEGDVLTPEVLALTMDMLQRNFPAPLAFKPNSQQQSQLAAETQGLAVIDQNAVYASRSEMVLNAGRATGRLRIVPRLDDDLLLAPGDIVVLGEAPLRLSPVAGIITAAFSTPLAHVNLLAKSWKIPNGYVRDALTKFAAFDGQWVRMEAGETITIRRATAKEIAAAQRSQGRRKVQIARSDLTYRLLPALGQIRARDSVRVGSKAANLGEIVAHHNPATDDFEVPGGYAIPFAWYQEFLQINGLDRKIAVLLADPKMRSDGAYRRQRLAALREDFKAGKLPMGLDTKLAERTGTEIGDGGVFVRSSTNSEDLPGFNGAGLYSSVPNVTDQASLEAAVKVVWGSVWNDGAFAAREAAGIDHRSVMAGVLVQRGMNSESSGVMITENPFDPDEWGTVFINAKRGLGIRVVEGRRMAEQLLYRPDPESIQVLTRSTDDAMLSFDAGGGVREIAVEPGRLVLTDERAKRLAKVARRIAIIFGGRVQDIEWLMIGETIYIVQSRPYLRGN